MIRAWPILLLAFIPARYAWVDAQTVKTSIYLGSVTLSASRFVRRDQNYAADYTASVFPYFFLNESGQLFIEVPEADLRRLDQGRAIDFRGRAVRRDGRVRAVTGRVTPTSGTTGQLKVRIIVNHYLTLVFDSTYQLPHSQ